MDDTISILSPKTRPRCVRACGNCRRRKERCNGLQPCQRCRSRNVGNACRFEQAAPMPARQKKSSTGRPRMFAQITRSTNDLLSHQITGEPASTTSFPTPLADSSASTLLQNVRSIAQLSIGDSEFSTSIHDPVREPPIERRTGMRFHGATVPPPRIDDPEEAVRLLNWFLYSTNGYLDLFDMEKVRTELVTWIASSQEGSDLQSAIFYLVLAIGAQTCPNGLDLMADEYFNYGRHLGLGHAMAEASHATLQYLSLVSAYLMGQSLMDAAFIQIGSAVRAALVLGLHRQKATTDDAYEAHMCKRIWKTVRSQDLFLSSILGQPITAKHHHDTALVTNCSATADICNILEDVLTKIYGGGARPEDAIESIVRHHQTSLGHFDDGLENDGLGLSEFDEHHRPHIGVCHIKHGSYANIQLLTMPFLLRKVLRRPHDAQPSINLYDSSESSFSNEFMAFGCIDAAISLVGLFRKFLDADQIPKRLPMVVYAMFYVALSLGLAVFGDLDSIFPLQENIQTASELLAKLAKHDWLAKRYAVIIGQMQTACRTYVHNRLKTATGAHRARVQQLFGSLEQPKKTHRQDRACVVPQELNSSQTLTPLSTVSQSNQPSMDSTEQRRIDINAPADGSFSSHQIGLPFGQGVGEELCTSARGLLSSLAEGDLPYGAQLWDSIWFDEHFT